MAAPDWGDRARSGFILRVLLVIAVLVSLAGVFSYGMLTAPLCLAPLWLAARRAGPRERFLWVLLAAPCALMFGWLVSYSFDHAIQGLPTAFTLSVVVLFLVSTRSSLPQEDR